MSFTPAPQRRPPKSLQRRTPSPPSPSPCPRQPPPPPWQHVLYPRTISPVSITVPTSTTSPPGSMSSTHAPSPPSSSPCLRQPPPFKKASAVSEA
ncbi:hypothetical protein CesoFtcFv8_024647 [Champsocephalus esox]|uniref:Uncharacterized protein n=1 Tax=Champsocephalus esox TaxID=159716 RepID=A0AAN8B6U7_9TELE|nr:hypothetical protein CesoFtcFv8_024647 [Champsocephalus esox]